VAVLRLSPLLRIRHRFPSLSTGSAVRTGRSGSHWAAVRPGRFIAPARHPLAAPTVHDTACTRARRPDRTAIRLRPGSMCAGAEMPMRYRSEGLVELPRDHRRLGRGLAHLDAGGLEGLLLGLRRAGRAGHDGARVAHRLALGGGEARDVADDRLGDVVLDVLGRTLLRVAADLADHDDQLGLRVLLERLDGVDVGAADDRVAADADGGGE